ncbi:MAG: hypothetical protein WKG07_19080 [Hymenobacter sp.]
MNGSNFADGDPNDPLHKDFKRMVMSALNRCSLLKATVREYLVSLPIVKLCPFVFLIRLVKVSLLLTLLALSSLPKTMERILYSAAGDIKTQQTLIISQLLWMLSAKPQLLAETVGDAVAFVFW